MAVVKATFLWWRRWYQRSLIALCTRSAEVRIEVMFARSCHKMPEWPLAGRTLGRRDAISVVERRLLITMNEMAIIGLSCGVSRYVALNCG